MKISLTTALLVGLIIYTAVTWAGFGPYDAKPVRVIDGDTVVMDLAVYPDLVQRVHVRPLGVDTPELHSSQQCERVMAQEAKAYVKAWFQGATDIQVSDVSLGKYAGRALGQVSAMKGGVRHDLTTDLLNSGEGRVYNGGTRGPWCKD